MKITLQETKRMQELAGLSEAENFLVKGDSQVIVRVTDAIEMIEASLEQLIQYPTKNVVGLAKNAMDSINDLKEILKIK